MTVSKPDTTFTAALAAVPATLIAFLGTVAMFGFVV